MSKATAPPIKLHDNIADSSSCLSSLPQGESPAPVVYQTLGGGQ
jgi:hypothetical protein